MCVQKWFFHFLSLHDVYCTNVIRVVSRKTALRFIINGGVNINRGKQIHKWGVGRIINSVSKCLIPKQNIKEKRQI